MVAGVLGGVLLYMSFSWLQYLFRSFLYKTVKFLIAPLLDEFFSISFSKPFSVCIPRFLIFLIMRHRVVPTIVYLDGLVPLESIESVSEKRMQELADSYLPPKRTFCLPLDFSDPCAFEFVMLFGYRVFGEPGVTHFYAFISVSHPHGWIFDREIQSRAGPYCRIRVASTWGTDIRKEADFRGFRGKKRRAQKKMSNILDLFGLCRPTAEKWLRFRLPPVIDGVESSAYKYASFASPIWSDKLLPADTVQRGDLVDTFIERITSGEWDIDSYMSFLGKDPVAALNVPLVISNSYKSVFRRIFLVPGVSDANIFTALKFNDFYQRYLCSFMSLELLVSSSFPNEHLLWGSLWFVYFFWAREAHRGFFFDFETTSTSQAHVVNSLLQSILVNIFSNHEFAESFLDLVELHPKLKTLTQLLNLLAKAEGPYIVHFDEKELGLFGTLDSSLFSFYTNRATYSDKRALRLLADSVLDPASPFAVRHKGVDMLGLASLAVERVLDHPVLVDLTPTAFWARWADSRSNKPEKFWFLRNLVFFTYLPNKEVEILSKESDVVYYNWKSRSVYVRYLRVIGLADRRFFFVRRTSYSVRTTPNFRYRPRPPETLYDAALASFSAVTQVSKNQKKH